MAIPDYQTLMLPLLRFLCDQKEQTLSQVVERLADEFGLSPEERQQLLPSGQAPVLRNRAGWARTYLKKAGLIEPLRRGVFRISPRGLAVLAESPARIDVKYRERFPEFIAFRDLRHEREAEPSPAQAEVAQDTPEEALDAAYHRLTSRRSAESPPWAAPRSRSSRAPWRAGRMR